MTNELRECYMHGPFRGEVCPTCGEQSKLLMSEEEINVLSKILAGMLRHFPERYGVQLDDHGWVKISSIIPAIRIQTRHFKWLTPKHIEGLVLTDPRERYQVNGNHEIRARYGQSIPVQLDDLPTDSIPEKLYYQTTPEELELIRETGINPSDKSWVHLSKTYRQAYVSGLYHVDSPTIVEIDTARLIGEGNQVYRATEDIFLVSRVPPACFREAPEEKVEVTPEEIEDVGRVRKKAERRNQTNTEDQ
ncbi:MAG: RNA 2'-phosphotransferase [Candidatus Thermoplasmatota archaeon]|jgi:putative RNA 2'-phosphotransferase|nr:RNA 2'-phosphotransferase [Candidatus Thermoplasmatota archaeon]